jgi:hypothetical protein
MLKVKNHVIALLLILLIACEEKQDITNNNNSILESEYFYFAGDEKNYLEIIDSKIVVTLLDSLDLTDPDLFIEKYCGDFNPDSVKHLFKNNFSVIMLTEMDLLKSKLISNNEIKNINHFYYLIDSLAGNMEVGIFDKIVAKVKSNISNVKFEEILKKYELKVIEENNWGMVIETESDANTLEVSNRLYEEGIFEYAHPSFLVTPTRHIHQ